MSYVSKYFDESELQCHCGCGRCTVTRPLLDGLDRLREALGGPLYLSCAYRCPEHNASVGGVSNSQHTQGTAADMLRPDYLSFDEFAWYVKEYSGADGIGLYPSSDFIHMDFRSNGSEPGTYNWDEND